MTGSRKSSTVVNMMNDSAPCSAMHALRRQSKDTILNAVETLHQSRMKSFIPMFFLFCFCLISAGIFYAIEHHLPHDYHYERGPKPEGCLNYTNYWGALAYTNTIVTTIGYGNVYPCTTLGKVFTIITALIGIPLVLISLNHIGSEIAHMVQLAYHNTARLLQKVRHIIPLPALHKYLHNDDVNSKVWLRAEDVPIWVIIAMNISWTLICATYFTFTENWRFWDSIYCAFITVATIGFGDYALNEHWLTVISYIFIFVGLAILSASIKLVQANMENLIQRMEQRIKQIQQKSMLRRKLGMKPSVTETQLVGKPEAMVDAIIKNQGRNWLTMFLSRRLRQGLEQKAAVLFKTDEGTQTDLGDYDEVPQKMFVLGRSRSMESRIFDYHGGERRMTASRRGSSAGRNMGVLRIVVTPSAEQL